jgi:ribonucleotide monophosphatase NagD (HAD superfamily)
MDTTFLGERFQLSTKTASYWESVREELGSKPAIIGKPHPTVMEVIDDQALELLNDGLDQWYQLLFDLMAS